MKFLLMVFFKVWSKFNLFILNIKKPTPYFIKNWRPLPAKNKSYGAKFIYKGEFHKKKAFIKIGYFDCEVKNEFITNKYLDKHNFLNRPKVLKYFRFLFCYILIFEELQNIRKLIFSDSEQNKILEVLNELDKIFVIHGDIKVLNIIVTNENMYLVDFGLSFIKGKNVLTNAKYYANYQKKGEITISTYYQLLEVCCELQKKPLDNFKNLINNSIKIFIS